MKNIFLLTIVLLTFSCVQNGSIKEKGTINNIDGIESVVLPYSENIKYIIVKTNYIELDILKTLDFYGHPPKPISLNSLKKYMGCAYIINKNELTIATYGEWITKEGSAQMKLDLKIPNHLKILFGNKLSGNDSVANSKDKIIQNNSFDYWYNSIDPDVNWTKIKTEVIK